MGESYGLSKNKVINLLSNNDEWKKEESNRNLKSETDTIVEFKWEKLVPILID